MTTFRVQPMSRIALRNYSKVFRQKLGQENALYFPVVELFEMLPEIYDGLTTEIVEDWELPRNCFAETDIIKKVIRVKRSVYDGATQGGGFERMTIMHEIGHYDMLVENSFKLNRSFDKEPPPKAFEDPEWQAKCFSGEVMMPEHLVKNMSIDEIVLRCGVSYPAAEYHKSKIKRQDQNPIFKMLR